MQDFRNYDFTLTVKDLEKIVNDGLESVVVIVNGEYYEVVKEKAGKETISESDIF